mmetsp:Transcript_5541/g.15034  ORF Transcript_5541/g.15034 Transcript_5541/m.15034 type:complete len:310 (-) Transcript_5541:289-1218(-)
MSRDASAPSHGANMGHSNPEQGDPRDSGSNKTTQLLLLYDVLRRKCPIGTAGATRILKRRTARLVHTDREHRCYEQENRRRRNEHASWQRPGCVIIADACQIKERHLPTERLVEPAIALDELEVLVADTSPCGYLAHPAVRAAARAVLGRDLAARLHSQRPQHLQLPVGVRRVGRLQRLLVYHDDGAGLREAHDLGLVVHEGVRWRQREHAPGGRDRLVGHGVRAGGERAPGCPRDAVSEGLAVVEGGHAPPRPAVAAAATLITCACTAVVAGHVRIHGLEASRREVRHDHAGDIVGRRHLHRDHHAGA